MSLLKMSTTQKNGDLFQHDGYSHQRVSNKTCKALDQRRFSKRFNKKIYQ